LDLLKLLAKVILFLCNFQETFRYNDLWRYNVSTGHWAWLGGSGPGSFNSMSSTGTRKRYEEYNFPGSRAACSLVVDPKTNHVYIFGGFGLGISTLGALNDLWAFDLTLGMWGFVKGYKDPKGAIGVYGLKNQHNERAVPKPRWFTNMVIAPNKGYLYLFGGQNYNVSSTATRVYYMDSWRFVLTSEGTRAENWAWIGGGSEPDFPGNLGEKNVPRFANNPPGKAGGPGWFDDTEEKFYIFGGQRNPDDTMGNDFMVFIDDISERLNSFSTASVAAVSRPPERTLSERFSGVPLTSGFGLDTLGGTLFIIGIILVVLIIAGAIAAFIYTRRKDKEAGFDNFFTAANSTIAAKTTLTDDGATTATATKKRRDKTRTGDTKLKTMTDDGNIVGMTIAADYDDDVEVVKPNLPFGIETAKDAFIVGQKVGSQNGVPIYSGTAVSDALKSFGEHLHVKYYGESVELLKNGQQKAFWSEVELLHSCANYKYIAKMLAYSSLPAAILIPYYPLGNFEQIFISRSQTFRPGDILRIATDMARALLLLHDKKMAHRNFKVALTCV
jgi:hypothetical protein